MKVWRKKRSRLRSRKSFIFRNAMHSVFKKPLFTGAVWAIGLVGLSVIIPGLLVSGGDSDFLENDPLKADIADHAALPSDDPSIIVPVYRSEQQVTEEMPLEAYIRGVVAAEMPAEFELEALKAQAVAARTYIIRRIAEEDFSHVPDDEAWVTDTVQHQAYLSAEDMRERWGVLQFSSYWKKLTRAVDETRGIVMTYNGQPIEASYFSTSNGYTENSEDYWNLEMPYLRSVESPWDVELSPKYKQVVTFTPAEFAQLLGITETAVMQGENGFFRITERTDGNRIKEAVAGQTSFTGREMREKLGLASSHFDIRLTDSLVEITTYGYGHGVGMSQYGAQGMALEGKTMEDILKHYYQGIELESISNLAVSAANLAKVIEEQV